MQHHTHIEDVCQCYSKWYILVPSWKVDVSVVQTSLLNLISASYIQRNSGVAFSSSLLNSHGCDLEISISFLVW